MSIKLEACPFCGGQAYLVQPGTSRQSCIVECGNCGARHDSGDEGALCGTSWNRRASSAEPAGEVLNQQLEDAKADVLRLHSEKMALLEKYVYCAAPAEGSLAFDYAHKLIRERMGMSVPAGGGEAADERAAMTQAWGEISAQQFAKMTPRQFYEVGWVAARAALATAPTMSEAVRDVLAERRRQVEMEGFTPEHDDAHDEGQMAAAGYYALASSFPHSRDLGRGHQPTYWPWNPSWWKPTTARRNLVKAVALGLAEIERLDRAGTTA